MDQSIDLIRVLGNISQSILPIIKFITGLAYLIGITLVFTALAKLKQHAGSKGQHESHFVPFSYFLGGLILIFLPTGIESMSTTVFGSSNPLSYSDYNPFNIYTSIHTLIKMAGIVWFIRGCVLLVHSSKAGEQEGPKGLAFLVAGVFAMNFDYTMNMLNHTLTYLMSLSGLSNLTN